MEVSESKRAMEGKSDRDENESERVGTAPQHHLPTHPSCTHLPTHPSCTHVPWPCPPSRVSHGGPVHPPPGFSLSPTAGPCVAAEALPRDSATSSRATLGLPSRKGLTGRASLFRLFESDPTPSSRGLNYAAYARERLCASFRTEDRAPSNQASMCAYMVPPSWPCLTGSGTGGYLPWFPSLVETAWWDSTPIDSDGFRHCK
jgi:hypothetical protein